MASFHLLNKKTHTVTVTYSRNFGEDISQPFGYMHVQHYIAETMPLYVLVKGRRTCITGPFGFLTFHYTQST